MNKFSSATAAVFALMVAASFFACKNDEVKEVSPIPTEAQMLARGEYLVSSIGCDDCHSPKRMGAQGPEIIPERRFSGYPSDRPVQKPDTSAFKSGYMLFAADGTAAIGPWGVSFSANISSDTTGIGGWTESHFLTAMRTGKMKGLDNGRPMLPPMPWFNFKNLTDEDLKAIFAYLKSTAPVENLVPAPMQLADIQIQ